MSVHLSCPHCKQELHLSAGTPAGQLHCPLCQGVFIYKPPPTTAPAPPAPLVAAARQPAAAAAAALPPTAAPRAVSASAPTDARRRTPILGLLPAGLLALVLLGFIVRDRFVASAPIEEHRDERETLIEVPIDPDPLLAVKFASDTFGLTMTKEKDENGKNKRLTFSEVGKTNNAMVQIDGATRVFGKYFFTKVGTAFKGEEGKGVDSNRQPPLLRGRWVNSLIPLGKDPTGRERIGRKAVYLYEEQRVQVTQLVEIVADEQVAPGQTKRRLDTCLVRHLIENLDERPHSVALRFELDTFIGGNDGVPFTIPGASGLCTDYKDFPTPASIPDFIQALERPSLDNPGTVAHLTLRLGGRLDPPDRVSLCNWKKVWWPPDDAIPYWDWSFPLDPMAGDSCVVLYWKARELPPKGQRELGFAYGLGHVSGAEGGGKLALTVGGSLRPGKEFTATAYVNEPLRGQTVTLELPDGLTRTDGAAMQTVAPLPAGAASRNSPVTWKVKADRAGRFTLRVKSSTGAVQGQKVTVVNSGGIFD